LDAGILDDSETVPLFPTARHPDDYIANYPIEKQIEEEKFRVEENFRDTIRRFVGKKTDHFRWQRARQQEKRPNNMGFESARLDEINEGARNGEEHRADDQGEPSIRKFAEAGHQGGGLVRQ